MQRDIRFTGRVVNSPVLLVPRAFVIDTIQIRPRKAALMIIVHGISFVISKEERACRTSRPKTPTKQSFFADVFELRERQMRRFRLFAYPVE